MLRLLILLTFAVPAVGQYPEGAKVSESVFVIQGGKRIGIAEWTTPKAESDSDKLARLRAAPFRIVWPDGRETSGTLGEYCDAGGDPAGLKLKAVTRADVEYVYAQTRPAVVVHPVAQPIPVAVPVRSVPAPVPFVPAVRSSTRTTPVIVAAPVNSSLSVSYQMAPIPIAAPVVVTPGSTRRRAGIFGPFGGGIGVENCSGPG